MYDSDFVYQNHFDTVTIEQLQHFQVLFKKPYPLNVFETRFANGDTSIYIPFDSFLICDKSCDTSIFSNKEDNEERAKRRARKSIKDLLLNNRNYYKVFVTITNGNQDNIDDIQFKNQILKKLNNLRNRKGLIDYLLVPERHKSGRVHFHGIFWYSNSSLLKFSKHFTNKGEPIYNLVDFENNGFTTATSVKSYDKCINYIIKYISKDTEKIYRHYFYKSQGLKYPEYSSYFCEDIDMLINTYYTIKGKYGYYLLPIKNIY